MALSAFTRRRMIILAFAIPGIVATGIVAGFLHFRLLGSAIEKWGPDNAFLIQTLKNHITHDIDASQRILVATSKQPAFSSLPFLDLVEPSLNGLPEGVDPEKRKVLETLRTGFDTFSVLFVLSPDGDHYISHPYSVQKNLKKFNLADRSYFNEAKRTKKPVVSDSFIGADGVPAIAIDVPILNAKKEIVAHLGGVFHLKALSKLVDASVIRPFDYGFIVDSQGKLIAHSDHSLIDGVKRGNFSEHPLFVSRHTRIARGMVKTTERYTDPRDGVRYLVASSVLENGWFLALLRKEQSIIDGVYAQVAAVSLLVVVVLIGIGSIGVFMADRITSKWEAAEDDLRRTRDELEERVIERTGELQSSEQRFRGLFESSEVSIWNEDLSAVRAALERLRRDGVSDLRRYLHDNTEAALELAAMVRVRHVNNATLKLFGANDEDEFLYQIDKTFGPNAIDVFKDELCSIWEKRQVFRSEVAYRTLDGRNINAIISFQIPDTDEGFHSVSVSVFDITSIKEAEAELKQSQERFRDFANVAADWFWEQDADLRFTLVTEDSPGTSGLIPGDHFSTTCRELSLEDINPEDIAAYEAWLKSRKPFSDFRFSRLRPDGQKVYCSISGKPVFNEEGNFSGYRGAGRDVSDMVESEQIIRAERDRAEAASRAKSEFLASMSHELRTPLNAVLGFAQMLQFDQRNPLTQSQNEQLDNILTGGKRLLGLVNQVLDLAKIESDGLDLYLEEVNADKIISDCIAQSRPLGESRDIKIINQPGVQAYLRTDRYRVSQALLNLLSNAIKFNSVGGRVVVASEEVENGFLRISVTDDGIGIAEEDQEKVFMMFHRIDADPMKTREGTGIGLTVAKHLVEKMAGRIGFESEEGVGSTFWLELPLASNDETLIWTKSMRVGIDALDEDHQVLVSLINQILKDVGGDPCMEDTVSKLIDYTRYHFRRKEAVMEACGYSDLSLHRQHHRDVAGKVADLAEAWRRDHNAESLDNLRRFLRTGMFDQTIKADAKISLKAKGKDQEIRRALENIG